MYTSIHVVKREEFLIQLSFFNNSRKPVGLAIPYLFLDGQMIADHFKFEPRFQYLGAQVKRKPFLEEEIQMVEAGETVYSEVIDLRKFYRIDKNKEGIQVYYSAMHPTNGEGGKLELLESKKANVGKVDLYFGYPKHLFQ